MKKILLAAILGGLAAFVWSNLSWMFLPWHAATMNGFDNESDVMAYLREQVPEPGYYYFPAWPDEQSPESMEAFKAAHREGPVGSMIMAPGSEPMPPSMMLTGLLFDVLAAGLAAWLLSIAVGGTAGYGCRVMFVATIGVIVAIMGEGMGWNWMGLPGDFALVMILDHMVTWVVIGCVAAALIKPPTARRQD